MQDYRDGQCYLCAILDNDHFPKMYTEEHHVFGGTANRKLSEHYGLKVRLCLKHHTVGPAAVHQNADNMELLHKAGEIAFIKKYSYQDFMNAFQKNYLDQEEIKEYIEDDHENKREV